MNHLHPRLGPNLTSTLSSSLASRLAASDPLCHEAHALIDCIDDPSRLRRLPVASLQALANEVRREMISSVSKTGGHLGSGLGTVELTVALHYVFDTPAAKLIWDVSHQCYPHKILTGRRSRMETLRKQGGLAGFTSRSESPYDPFGAAHSSTAISAGLGFATARDLAGDDYDVVSVVGDGAMSGGMAFEGLNNLGAQGRRMIVIVNDNDMSIAPPSGALSEHLRALRAQMPEAGERKRRIAADGLPAFPRNPTLFDQLSCRYAGPFDGHDVEEMIDVLSAARQHEGPLVLHVLTNKGHGYEPAAKAADRYHGVARFDPETGTQQKPKPKAPTYTNVFAKALSGLADRDQRIVAVTAAMPSGTGLDKFAARHPDRCFDTGIAEQHAVTFCAGLAADGFRPFAAIYSTFLQRAYDQIVHDVAIQKLPVRFAIDRAGMVGADGVTHQGSYDTTYLGCLPHFVLMAAGDEAELARMVATAAAIDDRPSAFRYPRGEGVGVAIPETPAPLEIGRGRILREGTDVAILTFGAPLNNALAAAEQLEGEGISATVADARFAKPVDADLIRRLSANHAGLVVVEEGAIGGFATQVRHCLHRLAIAPRALRELHLPDAFIEHGGRDFQLEAGGIAATQIRDAAASLLR